MTNTPRRGRRHGRHSVENRQRSVEASSAPAGSSPATLSAPSSPAAVPSSVTSAPRRRRRPGFTFIAVLVALVGVGVVATSVVAGLPSSSGANSPAQAVDGFLTAIYETHDPRAAGHFVCERARDHTELDRIVLRVTQQAEEYPGSRTTWTYPPIHQEGRTAAAEVTLTMTTPNEQVASRELTFLLVDDGGWWVCDVQSR
jgi:Type II secretory pathway, pseudopilin PulG